ncbi:hypothetical protein BGX31_011315 [Mortierella sp. GBA43]|nr:hypothetical protein BGX31_011315 [Mortierella sp. GBA43]
MVPTGRNMYKVIPAGYAPDTLSDYLFDLDDYSYHSPEAVYLREKQREKREEASYHLDQQDRQRHDDPWLRHLFDELANDDPLEYQSTLMETYTQSSTSPFPHGSSSSRINALSDSDYTSYMRRGMGRTRAEKEAQEWEEWVQEQERIKRQQSREEQRQKDERARQRRQERKERERHERDVNNDHDNTPANQLRKRKLVDMARQSYEHGWQILNEREQPLSMDMIPWPPLGGTSEEPVPQASSASKESSELLLFDFLFFGTTAGQLDVRKRLLRREQLRFHPDKFKQRFGARMATETEAAKEDEASHGSERGQILEMVERVARAFNEIGEMLQTSV